ncbi:hypothetical protein EC957_003177 [Mortierella hygrophila]|uniref:RNI-like protein n=1 Tax=Mortierella hygrophila TaxID=979708 RepID=A0A9P6FES8_9FUNG|nr:hypothetical protein EC957_003177 [Mortierella hygrophila]
MTKIFQTHPLDLHEIRSRIASSLGLKDLASCARVSQDWSDSFTPPLYNSVVMSKQGPSMESIERNKHLIQRLKIQSSAYAKISSTSARDKVVFSVMANSTLTTLDLSYNSIGDSRAQALADALKTNSTLTSLDLQGTLIEDNGVQALSEALRTNSTLTALNLRDSSIGDSGAQALADALKTNSTLTSLDLQGTLIEDNGAQALSEALRTNSTLTALDLKYNSIGENGAVALSKVSKAGIINIEY